METYVFYISVVQHIMRTNILPIYILAIIFSCQPNNDYLFEREVLDCFYEQYHDNGIDIKASIDSATSALIKYKVLGGNRGEDIMNLVVSINKSGWPNIESANELVKELKSIKFLPSGLFCYDSSVITKINNEFSDSKFKYIIGIYDSIEMKGDISDKIITNEILEVFNENDFDNITYKTLVTVTLSNFILMSNAMSSGVLSRIYEDYDSLPPPDHSYLERRNEAVVLNIKLTANDKIEVNGEQISLDNTLIRVEEFIRTYEALHVISLSSNKSTSHKYFVSVLGDLTGLYNKIRNGESQNVFKMKFEDLDEPSKLKLTNKFPQNISISEPSAD